MRAKDRVALAVAVATRARRDCVCIASKARASLHVNQRACTTDIRNRTIDEEGNRPPASKAHPIFQHPRAALEQAAPLALTIDRAGNLCRVGGVGDARRQGRQGNEVESLECARPRPAVAVWDQGDELEELSPVFCAFDDCVYRHGMYKYQHVGTDYIVTCPAISAPFAEAERPVRPSRQPLADKNTSMAALAAELVHIAQQWQVTVQIGIHSGSCVGAVLGSLRSFYCIIGDTVNVASRLCHAAEPGQIITSEALAKTVPELCVHLMQLDLKGVGPFAAYKMKQDQIPSNRCPVRRRHGSRGSEAAGDTCDGGELSSPASPTDDARAEVRRCGCPHLARC